MCDCGGNGGNCSLPPHPHKSPLLPNPTDHHWHPPANSDAAHLKCQPSHFRCLDETSPKMAPLSAPVPMRVFVSLLPQPSVFAGSADGMGGGWGGSGWPDDEDRGARKSGPTDFPFLLLSDYGSVKGNVKALFIQGNRCNCGQHLNEGLLFKALTYSPAWDSVEHF